jgi:hypothetical protein
LDFDKILDVFLGGSFGDQGGEVCSNESDFFPLENILNVTLDSGLGGLHKVSLKKG